ncbi:asparagine synthase (glutamine-hydrolyzing) [Actinokineospora baliensis]|nr:asparagine synthase (glutamine-hydrolyzing) [Actinokineospora baliensis]
MADRRAPHDSGVRSGWSVRDAGRLRLWHGQPGPARQVTHVEVPGCQLFLVGVVTTPERELAGIARRLAKGEVQALGSLDGSRVVFAVLQDEVLVAGDLAGQLPVFYAIGDDEVIVSSEAGHAASKVRTEVDYEWLIARLQLSSASDVWWEGSPWRHVRAVRPGWLLRIAAGKRVSTDRWLVLDKPRLSLAEGSQRLDAALRRATRSRVVQSSLVTADLSGGLDSSTVAALAALDAPVRATTLVVDGVDDRVAAREIAKAIAGLDHQELHVPDEVLPYSDLGGAPFADEPSTYSVTHAWGRWWRQAVAANGSDVHLCGDGGDGVLLSVPAYLADLATPRTLGALWQHANGWARLRHQPALALIRAAIRVHLTSYRDALVRAADDVQGLQTTPSGWAHWISRVYAQGMGDWATPQASRIAAQRLGAHAATHRVPPTPGVFGIGDSLAWSSLNTYSRTRRADVSLALEDGVDLHSPYLDDEIIRICWSIPPWVRTTPASLKPILRATTSNLLPPEIVNRRTKGDYSQVGYRGLKLNVKDIDDLLSSSTLAALGLVDARAARTALHRGASGVRINLGALDALIGAELWLRAAADGGVNRALLP